MALSWQPLPIWPYVVLFLAVTAVLTHIFGYRRLGTKDSVRLLVVTFTMITAVLLTLAAFNPQLISDPSPLQAHLAVLVDVSDSVLRDKEDWLQMQKDVSQLLATTIDDIPEEIADRATASLVTFGSGLSSVELKLPLRDLPAAFQQLNESNFSLGNATNIENVLKNAQDNIQRAGNQGAILLISDGNETTGDAAKMAELLAQQSIPIHVYPLTSPPPGIAIASAYLPNRVDGRVPAILRFVLQNQSLEPINTQLIIEQNPGLLTDDTLFGMPLKSESFQTIPGKSTASPPPQPLLFEGLGLQYIDITLVPEPDGGEYRRRLFTHVTRPVHVLAVAGDNRWVDALSSDTTVLTQITPAELTADYDLKEIDVVVVSSVPADEFPAGTLQMLAEANVQNGVGIFLINGDHAGADIEEDPTVLMSYENTPLEELLPVTTDKRVFFEQPPTRNVVILIDHSGSMDGNNLQLAKQVAIYIVQNLLRDTDYLDVIAFDENADHIVTNLVMNEGGKREAVNGINSIGIGNGTNPMVALELIRSRQLTQCGLIFISDGEFAAETVSKRPECRATTFAIGKSSVPDNAPIRLLADPFPVTTDFNPANITIPYFEPEEREKNFEPGEYLPRADTYSAAQLYTLPVPDLPLVGNAISTLIYSEDVVQIAVRPRFADPLLAYRENDNGYVGVFLTAFPEEWIVDEIGHQAIDAWIKRTVPYLARDRYDFKIEEWGNTISVQISVIGQNGAIPAVTDMSGSIETDNGEFVPVTLTPNQTIPGVFSGEIRLSQRTDAQLSQLVLVESGPDALPRSQRVPFLIPPSVNLSAELQPEAYTYGLNATLLQTIAEIGKGVYAPSNKLSLFRSQSGQPLSTPLWPYIVIVAMISYLVAIALRRLYP